MLKLLLYLFSIFYIYVNIKSYRAGFILGYMILIGLPIGSTNKIIDYLDIINIAGNGINLIHLVVFVLFFSAMSLFINKKICKFKIFKILIYMFVAILTGIIVGIVNHQSIVSDGQKYIMLLMWIFTCTIFLDKSVSFNSFMNYTNVALIFNLSCMIIMNVLVTNLCSCKSIILS